MSTKKLQILDSLIKQAQNADTLDGKHASEFAAASDVDALEDLVGDIKVAVQIEDAINAASGELNFITVDDIDEICGTSIQYVSLNEGAF